MEVSWSYVSDDPARGERWNGSIVNRSEEVVRALLEIDLANLREEAGVARVIWHLVGFDDKLMKRWKTRRSIRIGRSIAAVMNDSNLQLERHSFWS
jgi:hypothetical protein